MDWTERTGVSGPQIARSIQRRAEDGHLIIGDLLVPLPGAQGSVVMITCEPVTFDDGPGSLERFPTLQEMVDIGDELAPGFMYSTSFPTFRPGQRPEPPPGARSVPIECIGRIVAPSGIEVVGSFGA